MQTTTPPAPKQQAIALMARYSTATAKYNEAIAPTLSELAILNAALATISAPYQAELEAIKQEAEKLGLEEALAVFGESTCNLIVGAHALKLTEADSVQCDDEKTIIRRLLKEAGKEALIPPAEIATVSDVATGQDDGVRMAASACVRVRTELNKAYIQAMYEDFAPWFNARGIYLVTKASTLLTDAPKPRKKKESAKASKQEEAAA